MNTQLRRMKVGLPRRPRLFVAQVVICIEEVWFVPGDWGTPVRTERSYRIGEHLYAAADEEAAYAMVSRWIVNHGFSDSNHDGDGDRTLIFALGIHELEEVARFRGIDREVLEIYGVHLPGFYLGDVDDAGVPLVRPKEELEVFRLRRVMAQPWTPPEL